MSPSTATSTDADRAGLPVRFDETGLLDELGFAGRPAAVRLRCLRAYYGGRIETLRTLAHAPTRTERQRQEAARELRRAENTLHVLNTSGLKAFEK